MATQKVIRAKFSYVEGTGSGLRLGVLVNDGPATMIDRRVIVGLSMDDMARIVEMYEAEKKFQAESAKRVAAINLRNSDVECYVKFRRAWGHYLYVYAPEENIGGIFKGLGYSWTLEREKATRFPNPQAAYDKLKELAIDDADANETSIVEWR